MSSVVFGPRCHTVKVRGRNEHVSVFVERLDTEIRMDSAVETRITLRLLGAPIQSAAVIDDIGAAVARAIAEEEERRDISDPVIRMSQLQEAMEEEGYDFIDQQRLTEALAKRESAPTS